jgi:UDP-N-acetylmuramyl pentapeptide phosphotransferase/UDP-N-acetylglucosamine-1-phosphate transferase
MQAATWFNLIVGLTISGIVCAGAIAFLRPFWRKYALAQPNTRSSHRVPTPQGGGIAVLVGIFCALAASPLLGISIAFYPVLTSAIILGIVGAVDDLRTLQAAPRLLLQIFATVLVVASLPDNFHVFHAIPKWSERILIAVGLIWFVNLFNFMDGLDWLTVSESVPLSATLAGFGAMGALPPDAAYLAAAICGATIGFAPFNRPIARLFLGDVGSLPLGLFLGWLLIRLGEHHLTAALLLPLYYLSDATITLVQRAVRREPLTEPHRAHFYQRAVDRGRPVVTVIAEVGILNLFLASLATCTLLIETTTFQIVALLLGCMATGVLLRRFSCRTSQNS